MLRGLVYRKQRAEESGGTWQPLEPNLSSFKVEDFLVSNERAKLISDSQLTACQEKMVAMQAKNSRYQSLVQHMEQRLGDENPPFSDPSDNEEISAKAEEVIKFDLARFKLNAEKRFKCNLQQCPEVQAEIPVQSSRRRSCPSLLQRGRTLPAALLAAEAESSGSSDEDDVKGLKARFEAKIKAKERASATVQKAKQRFLMSVTARKQDNAAKKEVAAQGTQTSWIGCEAFTQTNQSDAIRTHRPRTYDRGNNTTSVSVQERGVNPILMEAFQSGAMLNEADMSADIDLDSVQKFAKERRKSRYASYDEPEKSDPVPRETLGATLPPFGRRKASKAGQSKDSSPSVSPFSSFNDSCSQPASGRVATDHIAARVQTQHSSRLAADPLPELQLEKQISESSTASANHVVEPAFTKQMSCPARHGTMYTEELESSMGSKMSSMARQLTPIDVDMTRMPATSSSGGTPDDPNASVICPPISPTSVKTPRRRVTSLSLGDTLDDQNASTASPPVSPTSARPRRRLSVGKRGKFASSS